jgi:hypothetical protein
MLQTFQVRSSNSDETNGQYRSYGRALNYLVDLSKMSLKLIVLETNKEGKMCDSRSAISLAFRPPDD